MAGGSGAAQRAGMREHVRPAVTRADEVLAGASGENFPVALRLLPAAYRRHLANLYFFARLTDDLGDEARGVWEAGEPLPRGVRGDGSPREKKQGRPRGPGGFGGMESPQEQRGTGGGSPPCTRAGGDCPPETTELRLGLLDELAADVGRIYAGQTPQFPVMRAMAGTVAECGIPAQPLLDLIQANRQDQLVTRYATFGELERYCELSANPVGRIVLYIFGVATPERVAASDRICTALQLAEHWQDVAEDLGQGRIYLPGEDLDRYGCTEADLAAPTAGPAVRELMRFETERASRLLDEGAPLVGMLRGAARLAVAGYLAGGRAALAAIRAHEFDVLRDTPRPRKLRLAAELALAYLRGR